MNHRLAAVLAVCFCCSVAASGAEKPPEWINGTSKKYAQETYLLGIGLGDSLDGARSAARVEIAKIFKAKVMHAAQEISRERTAQEGGKTDHSNAASSELKTMVTTDEILEGVEIAETWHSEKKHSYYALAVLNKPKVRAGLAQELSDSEETIQSQYSQAVKAASSVERIRALSRALTEYEKRGAILAKKRVVDGAAVPDLPSGISRAELRKQREDALRKIAFCVDTDRRELKEAVGAQIAKLGFRLLPPTAEKPAGVTSLICVKCSITTEPYDRGNPQWKFCNWNIAAELSDMDSPSETIAAIARQGQSSQLSESAAESKALVDGQQALVIALENEITRYFFGEEQ